MNMSESITEIFDAYHRGELSSEDKLQLEKQLASDAEMQKAFVEHQELMLAARRAGVKARISAAARAHHLQSVQSISRPLINWRVSAMVASLLVVAAVAVWQVQRARQLSPDALAFSYFEPDPGLPTMLGASDNPEFQEGMIDYKLGDYPAALSRWNLLLESYPEDDTLRYYMGVALLAEDQPEEALQYFEESDTGTFSDASKWYRSLALLRLGRVEEAKEDLNQLIDKSPEYSAMAKALLTKIR